WTAPCSFSVTQPTSFIDTSGSNFDTVLGVFTGSSLATLTRVASDDDSAGGFGASRVPSAVPGPATLKSVAGLAFQIRVRGFGTSSAGNITLHINANCPQIPTITSIGNQATTAGVATGAIPFTVADDETPAGSLILSGSSSNTTL